MGKIDEIIKKLELKKKKIEFLEHILKSAKEYEDKDFKDVKDDVILLLESFITRAIDIIENPPKYKAPTKLPTSSKVENSVNENSQQVQPEVDIAEPSVNDKMSFAMENRHLSGREATTIAKDGQIIKGTITGLDAPYIILKTNNGPRIKVLKDNISVQ